MSWERIVPLKDPDMFCRLPDRGDKGSAPVLVEAKERTKGDAWGRT